jgi:hypothetical protein
MSVSNNERKRDDLYAEAIASCGSARERLARAYEFDTEKRKDLLHIATNALAL